MIDGRKRVRQPYALAIPADDRLEQMKRSQPIGYRRDKEHNQDQPKPIRDRATNRERRSDVRPVIDRRLSDPWLDR